MWSYLSDPGLLEIIIRQLEQNPIIVNPSRHFIAEAFITIPNDSLFNTDIWDETNTSGDNYGHELVRLPSAWDFTTGSTNTKIAVVDTSFETTHPDLEPNIGLVGTSNTVLEEGGPVFFDKDRHGTHVAGIIAARGQNDQGISGVMWDAGLMLFSAGTLVKKFLFIIEIKIDSLTSVLSMKSAIKAGARVINYSAGFTYKTRIESEEANRYYRTIIDFSKAKGNNTIFVFGAGNDEEDVALASPASLSFECDMCLSVSAVNQQGNLANFSNFGHVSVAAPGVGILSTIPTDGYSRLSGTSQAAPFVSGVAGLLFTKADELGMHLTASQVKNLIIDGAVKGGRFAVGLDGKNIPILNAFESMKLLVEPPPEPELLTFTDPAAFQAALTNQTTITFDNLGSDTVIPSGTTLNGVTYTFDAGGFAGLATNAFLAISPPNTLGVSALRQV